MVGALGYIHQWFKKQKEKRDTPKIDSFITHSLVHSTRPRESFFGLPPSHPNRLTLIYDLAIARLTQYTLSNQREDLEKAILYLTESILFFPPRSWLEHGPRIFQALFFLAFALVKRSSVYELPGDAIYAANYLRRLRDEPHQEFGLSPHQVTGLLVNALAIQVGSGARNVIENIVEMAVLCHELLTLDVSNVDTTRSFTLFYAAIRNDFHLLNTLEPQHLDRIIECMRAATGNQVDRSGGCSTLAAILGARYGKTFVNEDYEEAASIWDEIISSSPPGSEIAASAQVGLAMLASQRGIYYGTPEYLEDAVYRARALLGSSFVTERPFLNAHVHSYLQRFAGLRAEFFGPFEGETSIRNPPVCDPPPIENFYPDMVRVREEAEILIGLLNGIHNDDFVKVEEAIQKGRNIVASSTPTDMITATPCARFSEVLFEAFMRTSNIGYLNESIGLRRQALELWLAPAIRIRGTYDLFLSLFARSRVFPDYRAEDLDESLELLAQCANNEHGFLPARCWFACMWASVARLTGHPTISTAYGTAMSLMQDTPLMAPTLQLQHTTLAIHDECLKMPLDYASYLIELHQLEDAIIILEKGRALLWSEMRHLRASSDRILQADPELGHKYAAVNQELEGLTKSISPNHKLILNGVPADDLRAVDPFGRLLLKRRNLLKERDNLVSQIQALPGFDNFLAPLTFDTLRSAASSGPVIIINHSNCRSDILILLHDAPPSLITTPVGFFFVASVLNNWLLDARYKYGPDSDQYNQTLATVLSGLYNLVGIPVIERLRELNVPEQSRVWWCPTSVFCSLPLHAMGPIPSDDGEERYFLDLYIPSYTPSLSALIPASDNRDQGSSSSCLPSLLLVAHFDVPSPDVPLSDVCEDVKVVQALKKRLPVKSLISEGATPTSVLDGLRDHQFVHFVCHGTLEARKPFDAGFELHGNERLTLLDIVRSRLPAAEFAFLSACHTAELTEGSSAEEGLHLAAAVQYCGFRSVVGTMWAMANQDGPDVAKYFYQSMFPKKRQSSGW
ncbi:CHAT domain-containing protein [Lactarius quietus]|nr:CHAT domain-containing protein [Lactarius quietus]